MPPDIFMGFIVNNLIIHLISKHSHLLLNIYYSFICILGLSNLGIGDGAIRKRSLTITG